MATALAPRAGLSQATHTATTSATKHSLFTVYGPAGNFLSNPSILAALTKLAAGEPSVQSMNHIGTSTTTTTTFGPATILIGPDQSKTFFVAAGTLNIKTNTHAESFNDVNLAGSSPAAGWL